RANDLPVPKAGNSPVVQVKVRQAGRKRCFDFGDINLDVVVVPQNDVLQGFDAPDGRFTLTVTGAIYFPASVVADGIPVLVNNNIAAFGLSHDDAALDSFDFTFRAQRPRGVFTG